MFGLLSKQQGVWCGYNRVKEKAREKLRSDRKEKQSEEGNAGLFKGVGISLMGSHWKVLSNVIQFMLCW